MSKQVRKGLKTRHCRIEEFDKNSEDIVDGKQAYIVQLKIKKGKLVKKELIELFQALDVERRNKNWFLEIRETGIKKFFGFIKDIFLRMVVIGGTSFTVLFIDFFTKSISRYSRTVRVFNSKIHYTCTNTYSISILLCS